VPATNFISGGVFSMGSLTGDADEAPVHCVTVGGFSLSACVTTQSEWLNTTGSLPALIRVRGPNLPVTEVSWYETLSYCNRLSEIEGLNPCYSRIGGRVDCDFSASGYRLPTEAEWEFACRGGLWSRGYRYSGGNDLSAVSWYVGNSDRQLHPVAQKQPNELGLYDMSGNVYEFCWDIYGRYGSESDTDPMGPPGAIDNPHRVIRGGNCFGLPHRHRCTARWKYQYMGFRHDFIGFRVARSADKDRP